MKTVSAFFASLCLSLLLAGTAFAAGPGEKVNINTADAATLARVLHNVGQAKADAIVAHRQENGPFRSTEQLALVKGIGLRTVEVNRERIEFGAPTRAPASAQRAAAAPKPAARSASPQR